MSNEQKQQITALRRQGYGYSKIAQTLSISENTVKSYCRRNGLSSDALNNTVDCKQCGKPIIIKEKCKPRQFCSDRCRSQWWNNHHHQSLSKTTYRFVCQKCGLPFESNGNKSRKYCSHECYIATRFGKERVGDE